ncbi:hypothetical protein [Micromonospora sp. HM5-17]|nr:hypothetical protein [Micromonospora sp. HM5-17]
MNLDGLDPGGAEPGDPAAFSIDEWPWAEVQTLGTAARCPGRATARR